VPLLLIFRPNSRCQHMESIVIVIAFRHVQLPIISFVDIEDSLFYLPPFKTSPSFVIPFMNLSLPSNHDPSISSAPVVNIFDPGIWVFLIGVFVSFVSSPAACVTGTALKEGGKLRKGLYTADRSNWCTALKICSLACVMLANLQLLYPSL
jgi:hypothetical protein